MENNKKKVSIALCTYNGERFLNTQIDSILNQSYKDFELIIVDDGSCDSTIEIVKNYQVINKNIYFYQNKENLGFIKNFERAISLCTGDYIFLSDQDDIWLSNKIEFFLENIKDNILIYSDAILIDQFGNLTDDLLISPKKLQSGNNNLTFLFDNCISGNTMMFKKELVKDILPIPKNMSFHDIWIAFIAVTYGNITFSSTPLTLYRRYSEQITHKKTNKYSSFYNRIEKKISNKVDYSARNLNNLNAFFNVDKLDNETKELIKELISHFENYSEIFFNYKLYFLLKRYKDDIFAIQDIKYRNKSVFKLACGLRFYKITLFIF